MQFDFLNPLFSAGQAAPAIERPSSPQPPPPPESEPEPEPSATPEAAAASEEPAAESPEPAAAFERPRIDDLHALACRLLQAAGAAALAERVVIRWNVRLRNTAGMAFPGRGVITLNPRLVQFGFEEIDRTLRHELAHLLAQERAGRRRIDPHGKEWKQACADLGLPGEKRSHDLPLPRHRVPPRHFYKCPGCGFELKRARPLKRNSACVKCCRAHNRGRYDARFRFLPAPPPGPADH